MKKGDKVTFTGASDEQVQWGGNDDPRHVLEIGKEYEIEEVDVHTWHTKVRIAGVKGRFNSVHFEPAPVPSNPDDEVAAVNYVTEKHKKQAGDNWYEEDESEKQAFLAGCTHKEAQQNEELEQLRAWKKEAIRVMPDFQEIGRLIGVPLGQSVHDKIIPALRSIYSRDRSDFECANNERIELIRINKELQRQLDEKREAIHSVELNKY